MNDCVFIFSFFRFPGDRHLSFGFYLFFFSSAAVYQQQKFAASGDTPCVKGRYPFSTGHRFGVRICSTEANEENGGF